MKKLALLLAVLMMMSAMLVACSKNSNNNTDETKDPAIVEDETGSVANTDTTANEETTKAEVVNPTSFTFNACAETTIYTVGSVNLRKQASFASDVAKKSVKDGTELVKIAESNESAIDSDGNEYKWFKVKYEDAEWYVKSILTTSLTNPDEGFTETSKTLYVNTQGLKVRQFPNEDNAPVAYLSLGDVVTVIAENTESGWYKISYDGKYVKGEFYIVSNAKYFSETPVETEAAN